MDLFAATLLTDLSAAEVATQLADRGRTLERDTVEARCRQLVEWGNLVPSIRDARVSSVAEYIRSRSRYQVSKLGGRVHRDAVEILQATDGAREVARELLGQIVQSLDRIIAQLAALRHRRRRAGRRGHDRVRQPAAVHRQRPRLLRLPRRRPHPLRPRRRGVRPVQGAAARLHRPDHRRRQPARSRGRPVASGRCIDQPRPAAGDPCETARASSCPTARRSSGPGDAPAPTGPSSRPGTTPSTVGPGPSSCAPPRPRRSSQLITNAKRLLDSSGTGFSRRADFLRLARWFHAANDDDAHRLYAAAFGAYPSRHLLFGPGRARPARRADDVVVGRRSGPGAGVAARARRPRPARQDVPRPRPDRRPAATDRRSPPRGRAAPGGRVRAGDHRRAARRHRLPCRARPAARPARRPADPRRRRDRRPRLGPAADRETRSGHRDHERRRHDHRLHGLRLVIEGIAAWTAVDEEAVP